MPPEIEGMTTACEGQSGRGVPGIVSPCILIQTRGAFLILEIEG